MGFSSARRFNAGSATTYELPSKGFGETLIS